MKLCLASFKIAFPYIFSMYVGVISACKLIWCINPFWLWNIPMNWCGSSIPFIYWYLHVQWILQTYKALRTHNNASITRNNEHIVRGFVLLLHFLNGLSIRRIDVRIYVEGQKNRSEHKTMRDWALDIEREKRQNKS